jgi:nitrogen regulatory protein P-II 1
MHMNMEEIKAIIQPFVAARVIEALHQIPEMPGVTVSEVRGYGKRKDGKPNVRSGDADVFGDRRLKLEAVVPDSLVDQVTETIAKAAHTGNPGDGKIFVLPVWDVLKIRTGQRARSQSETQERSDTNEFD